ncbi:MAG: hypothetical protein RLZZ127_2684, partial [Planctomycetota bacterium]
MLRVVLVFAAMLALAGCPDPLDRDPMPVVTVTATADPSFFQVGARLMGPAEARAELARIADGSRRQVTGTARMVVRIKTAPGADYGQVDQVVQWCKELGIIQM